MPHFATDFARLTLSDALLNHTLEQQDSSAADDATRAVGGSRSAVEAATCDGDNAVNGDDASNPQAPTRPLVLTEQRGGNVWVAAACPQALAGRVRIGSTLGQAQAILPELVAVEQRPHAAGLRLQQLADWALRFSPVVSPAPPNAVLLNISGCAHLFEGELRLVQAALAGVHAQGFTVRAGLADTIGAAHALATSGADDLNIAAPGETVAALAPLPVESLRIAGDVAEQLQALGVRHIADLLMLPRSSLPARFGNQLVMRLQQALGEFPETLDSHIPTEGITAQATFEPPLEDRVALGVVLQRLLEQVVDEVRTRGEALRQLRLTRLFERSMTEDSFLTLAKPTQDVARIGRLLEARLEQLANQSRGAPGLTGVELAAVETQRAVAQQIDLFTPQDSAGVDALAEVLEQLSGRLGEHAVLRPELREDYAPEEAVRYLPVSKAGLQTSRTPNEPHKSEQQTLTAMPRPSCLLARPLPVHVIALVPDGPPTWLATSRNSYRLAHAWGPERIETAWWRGGDLQRDYYQVLTTAGQRFWIFYDALKAQWFLHGLYS